jgi:integrase
VNTDLAKEVENFKQAIRNDNGTQKHADLTGLRVTKFIEGCGWRTVNDITLARATEYVAARRTSDGDDHISEGTSNHYMTALSEFCSFLKSTNKLDRNPVEGWKHLPRADRETRRALNHDEQHWLLSVTATSADRRHMTGWEREMVYKTALGRGFRSEELACLTPESFHLQGSTPFVYLPPDETKNSKAANQPITPELAAELREYLEEREPGLPVFPLPETRARSRLVRTDLAATREAWIEAATTEQDKAERRKSNFLKPVTRDGFVDFHALRHTYGTNLALAGVAPKVTMDLMRHSDINLTMRLYAHTELADRASGVHMLPRVGFSLGSGLGSEAERLGSNVNTAERKASKRARHKSA